MHVDVVEDLASRFAAGRLTGEDFLAGVERDRATTMPAPENRPDRN